MIRSTLAAALTAVVALALAGFGAAGLVRADHGLVRSAAVVDGLPTVTVRSAAPTGLSAGTRAPRVAPAWIAAAAGALLVAWPVALTNPLV